MVSEEVRNQFLSRIPCLPIIEIGPGLGVITEPMAKRGLPIMVVEIDRRFAPVLLPLQKRYPNLTVVFANALKINFRQEGEKLRVGKEGVWLVGALPYQLVEPLMLKLARNPEEKRVIAGATLLVSERSARQMIKERPPRAKLGMLTTSLFKPRLVKMGIDKSNFWPQPRTRSAIIELTGWGQGELLVQPANFLWRYLFSHSRAKIKNALREGLIAWQQGGLTKNQARSLIVQLNLPDQLLNKSTEQLNRSELEKLDQALFSL